MWASTEESSQFPYAKGNEPPTDLASSASVSELLKQMDASGVDGALIVQPINHKFDHAYVINAIQKHPDRFKGMLLHDPSLSEDQAVSRLEDLALKGFVGVRFNPYLWPKKDDKTWEPMSAGAGLAVYKRCAELHMPVGIMCFQGLELHYDDIVHLLEASPRTTLVLDHLGFTSLTDVGNDSFQLLLTLAKYPQVNIKVSALFRQADTPPFERVRLERLEPLLETFGADRLMFGTDFPFVLEQDERYTGTVELVTGWLHKDENVQRAVLAGTAEKLFGPWHVKRE